MDEEQTPDIVRRMLERNLRTKHGGIAADPIVPVQLRTEAFCRQSSDHVLTCARQRTWARSARVDIKRFREEMASFPALAEAGDRQLAVLNWLTRLSHASGCASPILVGCGAVELLTDAQTATGDVDIITPDIKKLGAQLLELGFQRSADQRFWFHPGHSLLFEFPAETLHPWERTITIEYDSAACLVISPEDLIVDRLETFEASGGGVDLLYAYLLYHALNDHLDHQRLLANVTLLDVRESFRFIRRLHEEAIAEGLSVDRQGSKITEECRRRKGTPWPTGLS